MSRVYKEIAVIPGYRQVPKPILNALKQYCAAMELAAPTQIERTGVQAVDRSALHIAARTKNVDPATYGVEVDWNPNELHIVDPETGAWIPIDPDAEGIAYDVVVAGEPYSMGVTFKP